MTRAQGLSDFASGLGDTLKIDGNNNRVGINSTAPTVALDVNGVVVATAFTGDGSGLTGIANTAIISADQINVSGVVTATSFEGDGSQLTGVSGFATALSNDQTSLLNVFFKTPKQVNIGAGTSITVESDATSGNVAFIRESVVHVAAGATFHVKASTTLATNVLGVFL